MNEHAIRKILEGGGGPGGRLVRAGLWLPGQLYGGVMECRRIAYRTGLLASHRAEVPVVSVGNLTAGGSGKTPFVVMLAREIRDMGLKPGIVLRGYRRSADGVSDEEALYRRLCPWAVVEAAADRPAAAARAAAGGAQAVIMDDGFQHLRLRRDLDIVLVDALSPWGGGVPFPGGLLREPKSAIARAHVVAITRSDQQPPEYIQSLDAEIAHLAPAAARFTARHEPARLARLGGDALPLGELRERKVVALSGIARPEAFAATLESLGAYVVEAIAGRDHADFEPELLERAAAAAARADAPIVTTEKDIGRKIFRERADNMDVWALGIEQAVDDPGRLRKIVGKALAGDVI